MKRSCFPYDIVFQAFISYTGGQSVSHVLLWQPSECVHLIVNCVILFSENKYDDDDDNGQRPPSFRPERPSGSGFLRRGAASPRPPAGGAL